MRSGFISALFISLVAFGIWFQQTYMEVYSQEFEMQLESDRSQTEVVGAYLVEVRKYANSRFVSSFLTDEFHVLNNGNITAKGNIKYFLYNGGSLKPQSQGVTDLMTGHATFDNSGPTLLVDSNKIDYLYFPNTVTLRSLADTLVAKGVRYEPSREIFTSTEAFEWTGPTRYLKAKGFKYEAKTDDLNLAGPVKGTFIPGKGDLKAFTP